MFRDSVFKHDLEDSVSRLDHGKLSVLCDGYKGQVDIEINFMGLSLNFLQLFEVSGSLKGPLNGF